MLDYGNSHSNSVRTDMIPTAKYIIKGIQNKIQLLCRMHCDKRLDNFRAIPRSAAGTKWYITEVYGSLIFEL